MNKNCSVARSTKKAMFALLVQQMTMMSSYISYTMNNFEARTYLESFQRRGGLRMRLLHLKIDL